MADLVLHPAAVRAFAQHLHQEERSQGTQEKYLRDVTRFAQWLDGRPVSREEALALIGRMPDIETLRVKNEKLREQEYKDCISGYSPEGWVRVLKTAYSRTKSRGSVTSVDKKYQVLLEHALFSEFSYALGMPEGQVPGFIAEHVKTKELKTKESQSR